MTTEEKLVLVDGSSYLFRAYHGLPPLLSSKGEPTGAIYGVVNMLRKLLKQYPSSHVAVIFDPKGRTSRYSLYSEYKANRSEAPEDLIAQIQPLHAIIKGMGFPLIVVDGYEADDVIGTLTKQAEQRGWQVVISTGDKDMAQLVNEQVALVNTMTDTVLDVDGVMQKFGVRPDQIIDYLSLIGDTSDNIPGVPGVGDKSALAMLQNLGGLDQIFGNLDKIETLDFRGARSMAQKMREYEEQARLSYQLATAGVDVDVVVDGIESFMCGSREVLRRMQDTVASVDAAAVAAAASSSSSSSSTSSGSPYSMAGQASRMASQSIPSFSNITWVGEPSKLVARKMVAWMKFLVTVFSAPPTLIVRSPSMNKLFQVSMVGLSQRNSL